MISSRTSATSGGLADAVARQQVVDAYIEGEILRYHRMRMISAAVNKKPGPDASLRKALADPHGKRVFTLAKDLMGAHGMLETNGVLGAGMGPRLPLQPRAHRSAAAPARCCATSSPSGCSASRTIPDVLGESYARDGVARRPDVRELAATSGPIGA